MLFSKNCKQNDHMVYCDSQNAMDLSKSIINHSHANHINMRYHRLKIVVEEMQLSLKRSTFRRMLQVKGSFLAKT